MLSSLVLIFLCLFPPSSSHPRCPRSECSNRGHCFGLISGQPVCLCDLGHLGVRCEIALCLSQSRLCHGGICLGSSVSPLCLCPTGTSGDRCQFNSGSSTALAAPSSPLPFPGCASSQCSNRGVCLSQSGGQPLCLCQLGFNGAKCENDVYRKTVELLQAESLLSAGNNASSLQAPLCSPRDCSGNGICIGPIAAPRCLCNMGYAGERCQKTQFPVCSSADCSSRGLCVGTANFFTCACHPGAFGRRCELNEPPKRRMLAARLFGAN